MISQTVKNLISVPKCVGCDERLSPIASKNKHHGNVIFCPECEAKWNISRSQMCKSCGKDACGCTCFPSPVKKLQDEIPAIMFYHRDGDTVCERMIHHLKHRKNKQLLSFVSHELAIKIKESLFKQGLSPSSCILTYIPRKGSSIGKYGFDQGREICFNTAKILEAQALPLFLRVGGKEQKKLNKRERAKNIKASVILNHNLSGFPRKYKSASLREALNGRTVVIIDDVMTSGATLKHGVSLIREKSTNYPVFLACVAKTPIETKATVE